MPRADRREKTITLIILRRENFLAFAGLLFTVAFFLTVVKGLAFEATSRYTEALSGRRIVLDPGHGGPDPGAVGRRTGLKEKDLVLDIALRLRRLLGRAGAYVVMTRETDRDFGGEEISLLARKRRDLAYRVGLANRIGADVYLSIHANSMADPRWAGAQVFYYPGRPLARELAGSLQAALAARLGPNYRVSKPGEYRVLMDTAMPAVVVEVGFLSHPEEEALLATPAYRERIAEALYQGLLHYFLRLSARDKDTLSPGEVLPVLTLGKATP